MERGGILRAGIAATRAGRPLCVAKGAAAAAAAAAAVWRLRLRLQPRCGSSKWRQSWGAIR